MWSFRVWVRQGCRFSCPSVWWPQGYGPGYGYGSQEAHVLGEHGCGEGVYNYLFCFLGKFLSTLGTFWHVLTCLFLFSPFFFKDSQIDICRDTKRWALDSLWQGDYDVGRLSLCTVTPPPSCTGKIDPRLTAGSSYPPNKETMQPFGKEIYKPNLENIFFEFQSFLLLCTSTCTQVVQSVYVICRACYKIQSYKAIMYVRI